LDVMLIQAAVLMAVHPQPAVAVTVTVPVVPAAGTDWLAGLIAKLQVAAAACVIEKAWPPIVMLPVRGPGAMLGPTE
jgi:hypothetical protein